MTAPADLADPPLSTERYGRSIEVVGETGSTNDDARAAAERGVPDGHVVVADRQVAGRGAHGRPWDSPGGSDLYLSIVARVPLEPARLPPLTLAVGLGVARALEAVVPAARVEQKWPNDVLMDGRKVSGVLVETVSSGTRVQSAILGIGVNVNRARFAPALEAHATSLRLASGARHDRARVLAGLLACVERQVDAFVRMGPRAVLGGVEARLAWRDRRVRCGDVEGVLAGLRDDGALRVRGDDGVEHALVAGTLRRA
ncbi:MAG TPA: biotin--[acetyl-CoA-carboxylase] ligase [Sandaracinaceae bacterium LLY-WYZ-13_1]|nr:biotin--[acetyl-CoA-carboxylase] ligase [Sandaracinaceae bacterium LLY-WYZ-13_1]